LPGNTYFGQQQVPGIPEYFRVGQRRLGVHRWRAARDAGNDGEHVTRPHRSGSRVQMPDVGLVQVQVHEVAQSPVVLQQMALEPGMGGK
jgi:hypothetical protein